MLGKKRQQEYFGHQCEAILAHLAVYSKSKNAEDLHRLRVEIKKVKAVTALLQTCLGKKAFERYIQPFEKVFIHAGKIRAAQVNLQLIESYSDSCDKYRKLQQAIVVKEIKSFCSASKNYASDIAKTSQSILDNLENIKTKDIEKYFDKQLEKSALLLASERSVGHLHELRKRVKRMIYVNAMLPNAIKVKLNLNIPYLHQLDMSIGLWHDALMLLRLLSSAEFNEPEVTKKINARRKRLIKAVDRLVADFSKKVKLDKFHLSS